MSILGWLFSSKNDEARKHIQKMLEIMKTHGVFDGNPADAAKAVEEFSAPIFGNGPVSKLNPTMLAISWLIVYLSNSRLSREQRLPFANAGMSFLRVATRPGAELSGVERSVVEKALEQFQTFIERGAPEINLGTGGQKPDVVVISGASSIECIMAERDYLSSKYGIGGWSMESQAAVEESGRFYDKLTIKLATGSKVDVWFDLTQARAGWGTAAIESLGEVPASQGAGSSDALLSAAKRVIQECLAKLSGTQRIPEQDSFLPGEEAIGTIMKTAYDMKLNASEVAMLLVDSGLAEHMAIAEETEKAYASTIAGTVGSENERIAKAVAASSLARHDKLLTEVARRAVESGSRLAPQNGSAGRSVKSALGIS